MRQQHEAHFTLSPLRSERCDSELDALGAVKWSLRSFEERLWYNVNSTAVVIGNVSSAKGRSIGRSDV